MSETININRKETLKKYRETHQKQIEDYHKLWRAKNRVKINAYNREIYRKKNPLKVKLPKIIVQKQPKVKKLWLPKKVIEALKPKVIRSKVLITDEPRQPCPYCKSIEWVRFNGHYKLSGKRRFQCLKCRKYFCFPYDSIEKHRKRVYGKKVGHIAELPFLDTANLLKRFNRPVQNFDVLIGIPCFGCNVRPCDVTQCAKMEKWTMEEVES